jgi:membrane protease YdiL (CAAX protease family)
MRNGYFGILRSIALVIGIGIGFNVLGGLILVVIYGVNIKGGSPSVLILSNSVAQLLMMLGVPILIARSYGMDFFRSFRLEGMGETRLPVHLIAIPIIIVTQVLAQSLSSLWMIGLSQFPDLYSGIVSFQKNIDDTLSGLTTAHNPEELAVLLFGVAIVPALVEESFFRGFIQTNIERSGNGRSRPVTAILITSVLFAAMHVSPLGFPGFVMFGCVLGWLAYRTCDIRVSALAHAFNNGAIVIIAYLLRDKPETADQLTGTPSLSLTDSLQYLVVSGAVLFGLLSIFQKMTEPLEARHNSDFEISLYNNHGTDS